MRSIQFDGPRRLGVGKRHGHWRRIDDFVQGWAVLDCYRVSRGCRKAEYYHLGLLNHQSGYRASAHTYSYLHALIGATDVALVKANVGTSLPP